MRLLDLFKRNDNGSFRVNGPLFDPTIKINQMPFSVTVWQHRAGYFTKLYLVKKHKVVNNTASTETKEKSKHIFGILNFRIF